jgi:cyclopropane-fatty-acyl-phospholipid synthase
MALRQVLSHDPARAAALELLEELFGGARPEELSVRLWDGSAWRPGHGRGPARVTLALKHPGTLRNMFSDPSDLTLGEAYIYDDCDLEGDIESIFTVIDRLFERGFSLVAKLRYAALLRRMPKTEAPRAAEHRAVLTGAPHSKTRDRGAVTFHYNLSNDFYRLWLDRRMVYSCAYFPTPRETLDQAQENKLDYLCRKLRLRQGERLLDIGCGWGALVLHAARHYGAQALGITLSEPQAELAQARIREEGLEDRCRVQVCDYRDLDGPDGFDKLVSVGMAEHVGEQRMGEYFRRAWRLLKPGGVFLNHAIAQNIQKPYRGESFVARYVFPDSELVPISTVLRAAEESGWEVRDIENLREHYMMTLRQWVQRLEQQAGKARELVGDVAYRVFRLYMAGSAHRFRTGWLNVYQTLLAKPEHGDARLPLSRADWYLGRGD